MTNTSSAPCAACSCSVRVAFDQRSTDRPAMAISRSGPGRTGTGFAPAITEIAWTPARRSRATVCSRTDWPRISTQPVGTRAPCANSQRSGDANRSLMTRTAVAYTLRLPQCVASMTGVAKMLSRLPTGSGCRRSKLGCHWRLRQSAAPNFLRCLLYLVIRQNRRRTADIKAGSQFEERNGERRV